MGTAAAEVPSIPVKISIIATYARAFVLPHARPNLTDTMLCLAAQRLTSAERHFEMLAERMANAVDAMRDLARRQELPPAKPPVPVEMMWTPERTAKEMGISVATLAKMRSEGRGPDPVKDHGIIRYAPAAVTEWMRLHTVRHKRA